MTEKKDSKYEFACKIFDNLDARTKGVTFADRNVDQIAEDIREQGMFHTSKVLRNSIIGGLEIKRPKGPAENVIIIGCACFGVAMPIRSYFLLLDELGISYTILRKEYCCGSPLMMRAVRTGEDREKADEYSREFVGKNMDQARELGAKRLVHLCVWCAYIGRRFYPDSDIEHVYALDILLPKLKEKKLSMPGETIAYYSGGQHRSWAYAPDRDFEFDWDSYRRVLDDIEGLTVVDVPKYCCAITTDPIFNWARKRGANTVVTQCMPCYGSTMRRAPADMRVKSVYDLFLHAAGAAPKFW